MQTRPSTLRRSLIALASVIFLSGVAATSQAQTVISSLPYTISAGGVYVLNSSLNSSQTSGNLITINASNVTIDFQNHYIAGPVGNTTQSTYGIYATERSNLTIKNGTVAYCNTGIVITGNNTATTNNVDHQIDNMRVTYCYSYGINLSYAPASRITNTQVSQIGSTTATSPVGINVNGAGVTVSSCTISNMLIASGGTSRGIYTDPGDFVRQCTVYSATNAIQLGIYQDNLASATTTAFSGGTDGGGNVHD